MIIFIKSQLYESVRARIFFIVLKTLRFVVCPSSKIFLFDYKAKIMIEYSLALLNKDQLFTEVLHET